MQVSEAQSLLTSLFDPITLDAFFEQYMGKTYVHIPNQKGKDLHKKLGLDLKNSLLRDHEKYAHSLTSHIHQVTTPPPRARHVGSPEAFADLIAAFHEKGYTVRFPEITNLNADLTQLTRAFEALLHQPVGVVLFWSLSDAKAPVHYDEVDVVVIHLKGKKRWFISDEPTRLPNDWKSIGEPPTELGRHTAVDVEEGDVLYLPRGTAHTVHSTDESLHVALGFVPVTKRDALIAIVDYLSEIDDSFRQNLSGRADDLAVGRSPKAMLEQIMSGLDSLHVEGRKTSTISNALRLRLGKMIKGLPKLDKPDTIPNLTVETMVQQVPLALSQVNKCSHIIELRQPGETTFISVNAEEAFRFIAKHDHFAIADIPGDFDDSTRIKIAQQFIASGFLTVPPQ